MKVIVWQRLDFSIMNKEMIGIAERKKITDFEPDVESVVLDNGNIYVGRKHRGKTAHVYFEKPNVKEVRKEED